MGGLSGVLGAGVNSINVRGFYLSWGSRYGSEE